MNPELLKAIAVTAELTNTEISEAAARVLAQDLGGYDFDLVAEALTRCRRELTSGRLTLAAIIERIDDGRPGPEVAWAMFPRSEAETVVWTEEMAEAFGVANPLADDPIAARMAFKEAYSNAVTMARADGRPVKWQVSFGHDPAGREAAVVDAVAKGRLSRDTALHLLPASSQLRALPESPEGRKQISAAAKLLAV